MLRDLVDAHAQHTSQLLKSGSCSPSGGELIQSWAAGGGPAPSGAPPRRPTRFGRARSPAAVGLTSICPARPPPAVGLASIYPACQTLLWSYIAYKLKPVMADTCTAQPTCVHADPLPPLSPNSSTIRNVWHCILDLLSTLTRHATPNMMVLQSEASRQGDCQVSLSRNTLALDRARPPIDVGFTSMIPGSDGGNCRYLWLFPVSIR